MDQNTGSKSGVYVDFFGQKAGTATGSHYFCHAHRRAFITDLYRTQEGSDFHTLIIEKHFYLEHKATDEGTIQYNVQKLTNILKDISVSIPRMGMDAPSLEKPT